MKKPRKPKVSWSVVKSNVECQDLGLSSVSLIRRPGDRRIVVYSPDFSVDQIARFCSAVKRVGILCLKDPEDLKINRQVQICNEVEKAASAGIIFTKQTLELHMTSETGGGMTLERFRKSFRSCLSNASSKLEIHQDGGVHLTASYKSRRVREEAEKKEKRLSAK